MRGDVAVDETLLRRLPLPLAQLYRRAHNAKTVRDRHDTAYCLWEASLKLIGSVAVVTGAERHLHHPELVERLRNLARPSLGHWWEFARALTPLQRLRKDLRNSRRLWGIGKSRSQAIINPRWISS